MDDAQISAAGVKTQLNSFDFFAGSSEMAGRMRALDWTRTLLGPVEWWPQSLKTTVALMLQSPVPLVLLWGPDGIMLYNDAYSVFAGSRHPGLLGAKVLEGWHEIADFNQRVMDVGLAGGTLAFQDQHLVLDRRGRLEEGWMDLFYSPVPSDSGQPGGVLAVVVETTRRVLSERRLAALRGIAAKTADAKTVEEAAALSCAACEEHREDIPFALVYLLDASLTRAKLTGRFGVEADSECAPEIVEVGNGESKWPWREAIEAQTAVVVPFAEGEQHESTGFVVFGANPRIAVDADYRQFFELAGGSIARSIAHARAYEDERRRAEALAELDRAKTTFFTNVSHEFRTPLTLLLGPLEEILAGGDGDGGGKVHQLADVAHRNALRLQRLVNTLLDFSRIEAGRAQASFEATDLAMLTADLASSFRSGMEKAGLTYRVDCPPLPEAVYVDRDMWEKIVLNLVSNAFKYTLAGSVEVRLRAVDGQAVLSVEDTGTGIPAAELPRIFERFRRVEGVRGRTQEGTGIGLALVSELVKLHGGEILVSSTQGRGSVFTVAIPFGSAHVRLDEGAARGTSTAVHAEAFIEEADRWIPEAEGEARTASDAESQLPRVLLAEDNADMRDYVRRLLAPRCRVEAVADGAEALRRAMANRPDLVLSDVMMPGLDGFGLLAALRSNATTQTIPVILLSARAGEEASSEGMDAGADDYLVKPFSARELLARVSAHLKLAQVRQEAERTVRESEARLRAFVMSTSDAIYRMSPDWREVWQLHGQRFIADRETPSTGWLEQYVFPEDRAEVMAAVGAAMAQKKTFEMEHRLYRADGSVGWTFSRTVPMLDWKGNIVEWFGTARDITERKGAEEELKRLNVELERTNRELEEFAYVTSHDLQEPIRIVSIYTELLLRRFKADDPAAVEYAGFIRLAVRRMLDLVRDVLKFSRTIQAEAAPDASRADLGVSLREAMAVLQTRIEETGATVEVGTMPVVHGDGDQLAHVFQNLLENALKYCKAGVRPVIGVSAMKSDGKWTVSVRDNGIGFDPEYADRIFGLFKRLHKNEYPGTGLGLAICKRIVEKCGGSIWAEGRPGEGATFYFSLPEA